jgi:hypothetical protein
MSLLCRRLRHPLTDRLMQHIHNAQQQHPLLRFETQIRRSGGILQTTSLAAHGSMQQRQR